MVVDHTGLTGAYDINLSLDSTLDGDFLSTLVSAVSHLGLRLDLRHVPVDVLIVTRVERVPTGN